MSDNLPPLPKPYTTEYDDIDKEDVDCFCVSQVKAYARAAIEADRVSRDVPADLAAVLLELDTPIAGLLGSHSWKFVPSTSKDSKEFDTFESSIPLVRWADHERTCRKIAALAASPQPQPVQAQPSEAATAESQVLTFSDVASRVCRAVAELPDRNSPEGWPDAMLVTQSELHGIMMDALDEWIDCIASMQAQKEE